MSVTNGQEQLVLLVQQATAADAGVRQPAEALLVQQEFTPGYLPFVMVGD
jgi:hypothetical protein